MNITQMKELCVQFSNAITDFKSENRRIRFSISGEQEDINAHYRANMGCLNSALNTIKQEHTQEQNRRETILRHALDSVKSEIDDIRDPHWHRMKHNYYEVVKREITVDYSEIPINELFAELDRLLNELYHETQRMQSAFVPPGMANVIGRVVQSYRKERYKAIASAREKILRCAAAIWMKSDIEERRLFAESIKDAKVTEIEAKTNEHLSALSSKEYEANKRNADILFGIGENLIRAGFLNQHNKAIGSLILEDPGYDVIKHLPAEYGNFLTDEGLSIPLTVKDLDRNILFCSDNGEKLANTYTAIALDVLLKDVNTNVVFADVECMGGRYAPLTKLEGEGCVKIWRTEDEMHQGLESLCRDISETYRDILGDTYQTVQEYNKTGSSPKTKTYVFIDNLSSITNVAREQLSRIVKNGNRAGVFVIMNVSKDASFDRREHEGFMDLINNSEYLNLTNGNIVISKDVRLRIVNSFEKEIVNLICNTVKMLHKRQSVIHLGPKLPSAECWQKKSSADGIKINIGLDKDGRDRTLVLSEDKPYALIIGDVDAGKSSLLHTIVIQTMANYDDSEVKIAVGDFKDGAEFNVYATSRLKSIEAVVNNEDPDVMASFLKYYIGEMHRRQGLFEQLEECTNKLVRKYETYRAVWEEHGQPTPEMPRIMLVVDEYQSLFENVSGTASMLSELVRKGRTYGIHIIMASQRATSDNPRNSFTGDLKNYFTSRFVFRAPQAAARSMLSERCADTGRENSGISRAALLKKGCAIYNCYMGQTEKDNCEVQCFYATDELIANVCKVLFTLNGIGSSILIKKNVVSSVAPLGNGVEIELGVSPCLRCDAGDDRSDDISDDMLVKVKATQSVKNIVCSGADERIAISVMKSAVRHIQACDSNFEIHIFGAENSRINNLCLSKLGMQTNVFFHTSEQEVKEEISRQINTAVSCVNVFTEIMDYPMLSQTTSALRVTPESESLKQLLTESNNAKRINIIRTKNFKNIRGYYAQVVNNTAIYILGVGETENIRSATSDACRLTNSNFDIPKKNAINAYYFNRNTDKFGKVVLYQI